MTRFFRWLFGAFFLMSGFVTYTAFAMSYIYPLSKDSTPEKPQAFYCEATKIEEQYPGDIIDMSNFVQMITGFGMDGRLSLSSEQLNQYYFLAFHDNSLPDFKDKPGYVSLSAGTFRFKCYEGTGGRTLIPGPFGKPRYR
jgi:hypothetical protein